MKKHILIVFVLLGLVTINSCRKEEPITDFSFTVTVIGCTAPSQVLFENKSQYATSYSWDFGDGTNSNETSPLKSYSVMGTYTVTLEATGKGGTVSTTKEVSIAAAYAQNQTWELSAPDNVNGNPIVQVARVAVTPFTYSGEFSETSDSPGWWIYDSQGNQCYRLPVHGNIVHDSPGDHWSFVGMSGIGCGMSTMGSNPSSTANGNFPCSNYINDGVVTLTTTTPAGTFSGQVYWTATKIN